MESLPNAIYLLNTRNLSDDQLIVAIGNALVYGFLKSLSSAVLHVVLRRKFAFSALYQVAFVLESHMLLVQAKVIVWLLFALEFNVDHYGTVSIFVLKDC